MNEYTDILKKIKNLKQILWSVRVTYKEHQVSSGYHKGFMALLYVVLKNIEIYA